MPAARLVLALALSAALLAVAAAPAPAAWLSPVDASGIETRVEDPQIAVDAAGNTTLVWTSGEVPNRSIRSAFRPAGGSWEAPFTRITSTFDCHDPRLAVNPAGAAVLVAECEKPSAAVRAAYRPSTSWNGNLEIPGSVGGNAPRVGIAANGDADAVWAGPSSIVAAAHRPAAGAWSTGAQISPASKIALEPNLAVSSAGYAHAIWREKRDESPGDPVIEVKTSRRSPGTSGTWVGPTRLSNSPGPTAPVATGEPQIAIGVNGQRMMAWSQQGTNLIMAERTSGGDLSGINEPAIFITESGTDVEVPRIAVNGTGLGVATWRSKLGGLFPIKAATTAFINGAWSTPFTTLSGPTSVGTDPAIAVDPVGRSTAVWLAGGSVSAATRPAGGAFPTQAPTVISSTAQPGFQGPTVTMTGGGDAVAAWSAGANRVAVAVDDVTPPAFAGVSVPATADVGSAASFSATASDAWSATSVSWYFGDGATATGAAVSHAYGSAGRWTVTVTATDTSGNTMATTRQIDVLASGSAGGSGSGPDDGGNPDRPGIPKRGGPVSLAVKVLSRTWAQIAKAKAIKLRCMLDIDGRCGARATVTAAVARKLGLASKGGKPVEVGPVEVKPTTKHSTTLAVKLTAAARAKLAAPAPTSQSILRSSPTPLGARRPGSPRHS